MSEFVSTVAAGTRRVLAMGLGAALLAGCGGSSGGGTVTVEDPAGPTGPADPWLATLDQNSNELRRFPWGPDFDDDGDGHFQFIAGGTDYDDTDASRQNTIGNGTFADPVYYATGQGPTGLYLADLDNDGHLDLVTSNQNDNTATVWWGAGDGTFSESLDLPLGSGGTAAVVGDFDEDGWLDIVAGNSNTLFLNAGNRSFNAGTSLLSNGYENVARDIDGDGHLDLVGASYSEGMIVRPGNGDGTFGTAITSPGGDVQDIALADFDGDGELDAVAVIYNDFNPADLAWLRGLGDGSFAAPLLTPLPNYAWQVAAADLNGDGNPDVLATDSIFNKLYVLPGDGNGGFGPVTTYDVPGAERMMIADYNGDTVPDLAITSQTDGLWIAFGNGDGSFGAFTSSGLETSGFKVAAGDLNGDGALDLVIIDIQGDRVAVQLGVAQ